MKKWWVVCCLEHGRHHPTDAWGPSIASAPVSPSLEHVSSVCSVPGTAEDRQSLGKAENQFVRNFPPKTSSVGSPITRSAVSLWGVQLPLWSPQNTSSLRIRTLGLSPDTWHRALYLEVMIDG